MILLFSIWFLILGFIIGSFLNVVVLRFNTGKTLNGRSSCYSCHHYLRWYELIPVVSWLVQCGRCRNCSSKISPQYLQGELLTGALFLAAAARGLWFSDMVLSPQYILGTVYLCVTFSILVVIFLYDLKHKIIPDSLSLAFGVLGIVGLFFFSSGSDIFMYRGFDVPGLWDMLALVIVPAPFVLLWIFSKGRFMGLGDPKLMVGMAGFLGLSSGFSSVFVSFWIGTLCLIFIGLYHVLKRDNVLVNRTKNSIMKMEIPFGPFLVIGFVVTVITGLNIFTL